MNDRQLRYSHTVWRERSFSRAAEKLRVSQPSLSDQVRLLEEELGFALFHRSSRGVEPSAHGKIFLEAAEEIVLSLVALAELGRELRGGQPGTTIRIGVSSGMAQALVPRIVGALAAGGRRVRPDIITATNRRIQRLVHQQRLDVGLLFGDEISAAPFKLAWENFAESEIVALLPPGHPLAGRGEAVMLAELCRFPLIVNEPRLGYGRAVMAMFSEQNLTPDIMADCDDVESLKYIVRAGGGVAIVPRIVAEQEIIQGTLVAVAMAPRLTIALQIVRRLEPLAQRLEQCVRQLSDDLHAAYGAGRGRPINPESPPQLPFQPACPAT